jgi:hypothetical protein
VAAAAGRGYDALMATAIVLEREEYIEQAYFFRTLRERLAAGLATQEVLDRIDQEVLATTRLPYAIQFLAAELKHSGLLSSGFARLGHYFTTYQAFIVQGTEDETKRFSTDLALLVLEREAEYRAGRISPAGLFVYQFEVLSRNRLGYTAGLDSMIADPFYDKDWKEYLDDLRAKVGLIDFADLVYVRSENFVRDCRRQEPDYEPANTPLFGEKEGKIARANHGRDPLFLFAALQRQLGYPEVPRPRARDDVSAKVELLQVKLRELETRLKVLEGELRGQIDLTQLARPELLDDEE